ncbi:Norsolorinic acid ketoreductase nor1 [Psilocybe cubensis]|uniref:Norsolorinic acid ketoreductase nor1 n=2 Tax=Psilocybe cubensis TaxID=181762 RepID=A0ACB8GQA6_PSICU|nr:Norsolorinic acid ketoreductase nor1 [Psilocybe cubensis]KAH9477733.1 Norsolorinic acid ketoreductase nor1 [Psilocybe cubensis]
MSPSTIYLVTGANRERGIGFALVSLILSKHSDAFVYATVRDPSKPSRLDELKEKYPTRIAVVKWIATDVAVNRELAKEIEQRHGRVDTVIGNAAIIGGNNQIRDIKLSDMEEHFQVNVLSHIVLFQELYALLRKSSTPRFIPITSIAGSIGEPAIELDMANTAYASSKTTLNWITRKLHFENEWLVTFPLSPGGVDTDMFDYTRETDKTGVVANLVAKYGDFPKADTAAPLLLDIIDGSTREKDGGQFINLDGRRVPW